jgi:hypothetical protein
MEYRYSHGTSVGASGAVANLVQHTNAVPVPFTIKSSLEMEQNTGRSAGQDLVFGSKELTLFMQQRWMYP